MNLFSIVTVFPMIMVMAIATKNSKLLHITEPHEDAILYKQETVNVTWIGETSTKLVDIKLMHGSLNSMEIIKTLATNVHANQTHFTINVPAEIPTGKSYILAVGSGARFMAYLGNLTIADNAAPQQLSSSAAPNITTDSKPSPSQQLFSSATPTITTDDIPMRLHNGRKITSLASLSRIRPKSLLNILVVTAVIKTIIT